MLSVLSGAANGRHDKNLAQVFPPPREGLHRLKKDADRLWLPTDVAKKYNAGAVYPLYRALLHEVEECAAMPTAKFEKGDVVGYEEVLYTQGKIEQTACFDQEKGGVKVWYFVRDLRGGSEEWVAEDMLQAEDKAGRAMPGGFACFSPLS